MTYEKELEENNKKYRELVYGEQGNIIITCSQIIQDDDEDYKELMEWEKEKGRDYFKGLCI